MAERVLILFTVRQTFSVRTTATLIPSVPTWPWRLSPSRSTGVIRPAGIVGSAGIIGLTGIVRLTGVRGTTLVAITLIRIVGIHRLLTAQGQLVGVVVLVILDPGLFIGLLENAEARELHENATGAADLIPEYLALIEQLAEEGARLVTILELDYTLNLRAIYNPPPFIFVRGELTPADERAIAVVGTRAASPAGLDQATHLTGGLPSGDRVSSASRPGLGPARRGVDGVQLPIAFEAFQGVRAAVGKGDS